MSKKINIDNVSCTNKRIEVSYSISDDISMYFYENRTFFAEYDENIERVPKSIAVIPFLCDILPVAWVTDSEINVDTLDIDFYNSIDEFKKGYVDMYPSVEFEGKIRVRDLVANPISGAKKALFFSGGVDAYSSLIAHLEESPILVSLWGSDVKLNDFEGWNNVRQAVIKAGKESRLKNEFVKTNFRNIVDTEVTTALIQETGEEWWHGFQHGIGIIGHVAPLAYLLGINTTYIASSYTKDMPHTCASDPTIDDNVRFCGSRVVHDQYDYSRQMKVDSICKYVMRTNHQIPLHVCWVSTGGENCCSCEKCYRTICAIYAADSDPNKFGFNVNKKVLRQMEFDIKYKLYFVSITIVLWKEIQKTYKKKYPDGYPIKELNWIYDFDFDRVNEKLPVPESVFVKLKHILGGIIRQIRLRIEL